MKVVAYGIKPHEKLLLATVNKKLHDITIIANDLTSETVNYALGKNALVLTNVSSLTPQLIRTISHHGIRLIISWNHSCDHVLNDFELGNINVVQLREEDLGNVPEDHKDYKQDTCAIRLVRKTIETLNSWPEKVN